MSGVSVAMRDARFPELEKGRRSPGSPATVSLCIRTKASSFAFHPFEWCAIIKREGRGANGVPN